MIREETNRLQGLILAAGQGQRLAAVSGGKSKAMTAIAGTPLLVRQVEMMRRAGIEPVVAVRRCDEDAIDWLVSEGFGLYAASGPAIVARDTGSPLETLANALAFIIDRGSGPATVDTCLVTNVDSYFRPDDFEGFASALRRGECDALMGCTGYVDDEKPLYLVCDPDLRVSEFASALPEAGDSDVLVSAGIYGLGRRAMELAIKAHGDGLSRLRDFQSALIYDGLDVKALVFDLVVDIDRPEDLSVAGNLAYGGEYDIIKNQKSKK